MTSVFIGLIIIYFVVRILQRYLARRIKVVENRYRKRKGLTFFGYFAAVFFAIAVLGNQLSGFSVMLGVVAAGIAFALQEVIASVAGWLALTFSSFNRVGDRVELGGIMDEIDQTNGQVAIASTTIHIVDTPPFDVHLSGGSKISET